MPISTSVIIAFVAIIPNIGTRPVGNTKLTFKKLNSFLGEWSGARHHGNPLQ
jgi:hypothetical protein